MQKYLYIFKRYKSNKSNLNGLKSLSLTYNNNMYYTYYHQAKFIIINYYIKYIIKEFFMFFNINILSFQLKINNKNEIKLHLIINKEDCVINYRNVLYFSTNYLNLLFKLIFNFNITWYIRINKNNWINSINYLRMIAFNLDNNSKLKKEINKIKKSFNKIRKKTISLSRNTLIINPQMESILLEFEYLFLAKKYMHIKEGLRISIKGLKDKKGKTKPFFFWIGQSNLTNLKKNVDLEKKNIITKTGMIGLSIYFI